MTAPLLTFPIDNAGWLSFINDHAAEAVDTIGAADSAIKAGDLTAEAAVEKLGEAYTAGKSALSRAYLLSETHPDAEVRAAAEGQAQALESLMSTRGLDVDLFAALERFEGADLAPGPHRVLAHTLRDFRRAGVALPEAERDRKKALDDRMTELSLEFGRNIRDGKLELKVTPEDLAGMPQDFIDAHPLDDDGFATITTDYPDYMPVREFSPNWELRTKLTDLYNQLAYPANDAVLKELLQLRREQAALLGYDSWPDYEVETRMVKSGKNVEQFLSEVDAASKTAADAEYPVLLERLQRDDEAAEAVLASDFFYLLSVLKNELHGVDAQEVRSYLTYDRVLPGVLDTTTKLLGITFAPVEIDTWHEDVLSYDVHNNGALIGRVHLDMHPRDGKYNHAACFPLSPGVTGERLPEATLLCNFSRGLMTHDELTTFFHEFGHLVHEILGTQPESQLSGIETEWDFVEAPSQMLEEWAWDAGVLQTFALNEAGEPIPTELVEKMVAADEFGRALATRRQLGLANVSYFLHANEYDDLQAAVERLLDDASPVKSLPNSHFYSSFGHLTGYGSAYYTYQWSLVIARDLLSKFGGDLFAADVASDYRTKILERGGSMDAADMVEDFLGRPYNTDAYREYLTPSH